MDLCDFLCLPDKVKRNLNQGKKKVCRTLLCIHFLNTFFVIMSHVFGSA